MSDTKCLDDMLLPERVLIIKRLLDQVTVDIKEVLITEQDLSAQSAGRLGGVLALLAVSDKIFSKSVTIR